MHIVLISSTVWYSVIHQQSFLQPNQIQKISLLFQKLFSSGGFRVGGTEARLRRGLFDDVIILTPTAFSRPVFLHSPSTNCKVYPFKRFTSSSFEKMFDSWYPEFVHIHVFVGIHEIITKQPRIFKTLNLLQISSF